MVLPRSSLSEIPISCLVTPSQHSSVRDVVLSLLLLDLLQVVVIATKVFWLVRPGIRFVGMPRMLWAAAEFGACTAANYGFFSWAGSKSRTEGTFFLSCPALRGQRGNRRRRLALLLQGNRQWALPRLFSSWGGSRSRTEGKFFLSCPSLRGQRGNRRRRLALLLQGNRQWALPRLFSSWGGSKSRTEGKFFLSC